MSPWRSSLIFLLAAFTGPTAAEAATLVAQQGDAAIAHDAAAGTWTLSAGGASLTLALDPSRDFAIVSLRLRLRHVVDCRAGGRLVRSHRQPFARPSATAPPALRFAAPTSSRAARAATRRHLPLAARRRSTLTRHYAIVSGSPSFETWTTYEGAGATIADLNALQITIPTGSCTG